MKKTFLYTFIMAFLLGSALTSCEDAFGDFLDKQPSNELTEEEVFSNWRNTEYYYYDIYNFLRNGRARINNSWMDAATDLATTSYSYGGTRSSFNIGNYYAGAGAPEIRDTWYHCYSAIRKCNTLLEKIDAVPLTADQTVDQRLRLVKRMKAEARTFRAYFYWELLLRYGPVPIITERLDPESENLLDYERPDIKTCFLFVLDELEASQDSLQSPRQLNENDELVDDELSNAVAKNDLGRITQGVSLALESRIKLYLASPRYASLGLVTWDEAAFVAEKMINTFGNGLSYKLNTNSDSVKAYQDAINTRVYDGNPEVIFWRNDARGGWLPMESPVGFGGSGGLTPSQNLVDMYDMQDGSSPFSSYDATGAPVYVSNVPEVREGSSYSDQDPYNNRDPRMYATILFNGSQWWSRAIDTSEGGADKPLGNANATATGYYNRKYMDDSQTHYRTGGAMYRNWIFIRYAEILLNYAEAQNEVAGPSPAVFNTLQKLRDRVGLTAKLSDRPDLQTQESLRNFIRKERTIELAFEDHRAWDVRRWDVAEDALARPVYGVRIIKKNDELLFERKVVQSRVFESKMYLYPIPESEIWKTGMENNPDW